MAWTRSELFQGSRSCGGSSQVVSFPNSKGQERIRVDLAVISLLEEPSSTSCSTFTLY